MKKILKSKYFIITMIVLFKITLFVMLVSTSADSKKKPYQGRFYGLNSTSKR